MVHLDVGATALPLSNDKNITMPQTAVTTMIISSTSFVPNGVIPVKYTIDGEGINPPLVMDYVPDDTHSMALIMEDPDADQGTVTHWVLFDIPPVNSIGENTEPGVSGLNTKGKTGYLPPAPPSGSHRYFFHVYALDYGVNLMTGSRREDLEDAMEGHIMAKGTLVGHYGPKQKH